MKSPSSSKTLNAERSTSNAQSTGRGFLVLFLFYSVSLSPLHAQVGNNNPTGPSGIFNGQVHTGYSYDPYTGNATRSITDIAVAGAVGEYPLALVRTANSRMPSTTELFGWAGGWNHNYNWILEDSPLGPLHPTRYTVAFPDGRVETFQSVTWDSANYYRVRAGNGNNAGTSAGVRERFVPLDTNPNNMYGYLILPDGGRVEFKAQQHVSGSQYWYKYHVTAIIDPYGLRTTIASELVAQNTRRRITRVTEPAGRYIQFSYGTPNGPRISQVAASDGRAVNYYYSYTMLDHVVYYSNANWTARYQYVGANVGGPDLPPLLRTCDDPMYPGPMKRIAYEYKTGTNADQTAAVYGQILRERYWDGVSGDEAIGAVVSTLTIGLPNNSPVYRTETRGDNMTRTFIYNGAGYVTWASDFMGHQSTQGYDPTTKFINSVINFNRITTDYTTNALTGNVTVVTFPLTQGDTPGQQTRPTVRYQYGWANCPDPNNRDANNPYYLYSITDEGGHTTTFTRDANKRVTRIDYPDGGYETFTYNSFGRVLTHRMTTGGTESFTYDAYGLKQTYRNPDNPTGNPTIRYYYDGLDRVSGILDVLSHPTNWEYNDRGQITMTTLPWDNGTRYTITNAYNADGTVQSKTDELGHVTSYIYDDYRRLKSVTPPARGDGTGTHTTTYNYWAGNWISDDYRCTDSTICWVVLPSGKKIKTVYDDNRRKSSVTVAPGTADEATTSYTYDNVGNVTRVTNPRGYSITTGYDERNRPSSINVIGQLTTFTYDTAGRKKTIARPNGQVITYSSFDEMNRVLQQTVTQAPTGAAITKYTYYPSGLLHTMQDPRLVATQSSEIYEYIYDVMGRKAWAVYPIDSGGVRRSEGFTYDDAGRYPTHSKRHFRLRCRLALDRHQQRQRHHSQIILER